MQQRLWSLDFAKVWEFLPKCHFEKALEQEEFPKHKFMVLKCWKVGVLLLCPNVVFWRRRSGDGGSWLFVGAFEFFLFNCTSSDVSRFNFWPQRSWKRCCLLLARPQLPGNYDQCQLSRMMMLMNQIILAINTCQRCSSCRCCCSWWRHYKTYRINTPPIKPP